MAMLCLVTHFTLFLSQILRNPVEDGDQSRDLYTPSKIHIEI